MYGRGLHPNSSRGWQDPNSPWRQPAIAARLEELCFAQLANTKIAEKLSAEFGRAITKNAVIARRHRIGLAFGRWRPTREDYETPLPTLWSRLQAYHDKLDDLDHEIQQKRRAGELRL